MTNLKMQKMSSAKKIKISEVDDHQFNERRLEDKIRTKDHKIEEMKNNIYILEETIVKLKKKDEKNSA